MAEVPDEVLQQLLAGQRETAQRLAALSERIEDPPGPRRVSTVTVREFVPTVQAAIASDRTRGTYTTTFRRMVEAKPCWYPDASGAPRDRQLCQQYVCDHSPGGELLLHDYDATRVKRLGMWVYWRAREAKRLQIARRRLTAVRQDDPDATVADIVVGDDDLPVACGNDALRGYLDASGHFWRAAAKAGHVTVGPVAEVAEDLKRTRNPARGGRSLALHEVQHLEQIVQLTGIDPELDLLLVWFHEEAGARLSEAIKLRIEDIDPDQQVIVLGKKGDRERRQPVSASLIEALIAHAVARGAQYDHERVFRVLHAGTLHPLSESHYTKLWARVREHAEWAARGSISTHSLRKTTATVLERTCSFFVAESFLGHGRNSTDSNTPYLRVPLEELAMAIEVLTGERHPLADPAKAEWLSSDHVRPAPA